LSNADGQEDEELVKSLFDFDENAKYKEGKSFEAVVSSSEKKPLFKFNNSSTAENKPTFVLKPFFPITSGSQSSLFKLPEKITQGVQEDERSKDHTETTKQPDSIVEFPAASISDSKLFQRQIAKLKTLKGVAPSKKEHGFLSIERIKGLLYLVYRNFLGVTQFSGVISEKINLAKIVEKDGKFKVKIAAGAKDNEGKFYIEHLMVNFLGEADRTTFMNVHSELFNQ